MVLPLQLSNIGLLTFHRSPMMGVRLASLATISIVSSCVSCVRDLDLDRTVDVFAGEKARWKTF